MQFGHLAESSPQTSTSTVNPDEKSLLLVDSGASVHMMSKMDMSPEELETVNVSRRPTTVITADGSINEKNWKQSKCFDVPRR